MNSTVLQRIIQLAAACTLVLGCTACNASESSFFPTAETSKRDQKIMVTLGDSIAAGFRLEHPEQQRYSALLTNALTDDTVIWKDYNYAVSGDTTQELLKRLKDGRAVRLPAADCITVCIGANYLLGPFSEFLSVYHKAEDVSSPVVADAFDTMLQEIDTGLVQLETDLQLIYDWIRERNEDAPLVFLTVYHPYANQTTPLRIGEQSIVLADYGEQQIQRLNDVIRRFANQNHVSLAEIDVAFAQESTPPIFGAVSNASALSVDPHPNEKGQQIIADTLQSLLLQQKADSESSS